MASSSRTRKTDYDDDHIGPTPSFDLGISQEGPRTTDHRERPKKKLTKKENENRQGRIRIKSKIGKVYNVFKSARHDMASFARKHKKLTTAGFGNLVDICNWNAMSSSFVKWVVDNWEVDNGPQIRISNSEVLRITEDDVYRVYHLPRGKIPIDILTCTQEQMQSLWQEIGMEGEVQKAVHFRVLEEQLGILKGSTGWAKCAILYCIYCLLCPVNSNLVDFRYACVLEDIKTVKKYNWCRHVLEHTTKGINDSNKMNPTADFHFLLINYLERMGKKSRMLAGDYEGPSLGGWDEGEEITYLNTLDEMVGLSKGVVVGITNQYLHNDENPLNEVPSMFQKNIEFLRKCNSRLDKVDARMDKFEKHCRLLEEALKIQSGEHTGGEENSVDVDEGVRNRMKKGKGPAENPMKARTPPHRPAKKRIIIEENRDDPGKVQSSTPSKYYTRSTTQSPMQAKTPPHECPKKGSSPNIKIDDLGHARASTPSKYYTRSTKRDPESDKLETTVQTHEPGHRTDAMEGAQTNFVAGTTRIPKRTPPRTKENIRKQAHSTNANQVGVGNVHIESEKVNVTKDANKECVATHFDPNTNEYVIGPVTQAIAIEIANTAGDDFGYPSPPIRHLSDEFDAAAEEEPHKMVDTLISKFPEQLGATKKPIIEIIELGDEDDTKGMKKRKCLDPDDEYVCRRRRLARPSAYLKSPYEQHIQEADVDIEARIIASFAFHHELDRDRLLYKSGKRGHFHLFRKDMGTLQQDECVSSTVINVWSNILNQCCTKDETATKICLRVVHAKHEWKSLALDTVDDNRTDEQAANMFEARLYAFHLVDWNNLNIRKLEYVMIPAHHANHFVCYVVSLAYDEFYFLTSMRSSSRKLGTGLLNAYGILGMRLIREATCFITRRYNDIGVPCPHDWSTFNWRDPNMPEQKDANSCGVFVMKFMEEWKDAPENMPSFRDWPRYRQRNPEALKRTVEFRINIAQSIICDETNEVAETTYKEAMEWNSTQMVAMEKAEKGRQTKKG